MDMTTTSTPANQNNSALWQDVTPSSILHREPGQPHWIDLGNPQATDLIVRLMRKVVINPETQCWNWTGGFSGDGYPEISLENLNLRGHRVAYMLFCGPIPPNHMICHACDNPACINPAHLWPGTAAQNAADMYAKNRGGDTRRKLNPDLVRAIRMDTRSNRAVARDYGVSHPTIIGIRYNRIWQHVA